MLFPQPDQVVHHTPQQVHTALSSLGLERDHLQRAIAEGELQRRLASPFDVPTAGGFNAHTRTVRSLRETYVPRGWKQNDIGLSTIDSPDGRVAVAVVSGDARTGDQDALTVGTKRARGPATVEAVLENGQGRLFDLEPTVTWFLLVHSRSAGVWAELSLPHRIDEDGRITSWRERIILGRIEPTEPTGDLVRPDDPPAPQPIDVPVIRRAR